jgi:hypothetical protein
MNHLRKWLFVGAVATALAGCTTTKFFVVPADSTSARGAQLTASKANVIVVFENGCPTSVVALGPNCPTGLGTDAVCRVPEDSTTPKQKVVVWKADDEAAANDSFAVTFSAGGTGPCKSDPNDRGNHKCAIKKARDLNPAPTDSVWPIFKYNVEGTTPGTRCPVLDPYIIVMK